jgi:hypothetical protein
LVCWTILDAKGHDEGTEQRNMIRPIVSQT